MKTTTYLYSIQPAQLTNLSYQSALEFKITSAKQLIATLIEVPYQTRDDVRIHAIHKAIKHNQLLLDELSSESP